jgi:hypothetical protein
MMSADATGFERCEKTNGTKRTLSPLNTVILTLTLFAVVVFAAIAEMALRVNGMTCGGSPAAIGRVQAAGSRSYFKTWFQVSIVQPLLRF